jgi:pyruvate formate lyase activating enzyme
MIKKMSASMAGTGIFFNIQRFSVHDGPGIRTILFAKGCPLRCLWCSNPESQKFESELAYKRSNCIGVKQCGLCIDACPQRAIAPLEEGSVTIDRVLCDSCGRCVVACPANSLVFIGKEYSIDELVKKVEEDANYWWRSGGGPTIGGGEPLSQSKFVGRLLETLKTRGYNTVVDTCGHFDLNAPGIERALKNTNVLLYDIKLMDPVKHKAYTGHSNKRILSNILEISKTYPKIEIVVRTPVIPGVNDTEEDIKEIAIFLLNVSTLKDYELLAYHAFGSPKYAQLGRSYDLNNFKMVDARKMKKLQELARKTLALGRLPESSRVETGS